MAELTEKIVDGMVDTIVREVDPERVILFGSQVRHEEDDRSDIDFLIVQDHPFEPGRNRRQQMARIWRRLAHYPVSQDILIYTPEEVERWRHTRTHVIARALREGKVLYERV